MKNNINKKIKQTFLDERRHYKFKLPTSSYNKFYNIDNQYYSFK